MYLTRCAECTHINPPSSLYCNACGLRMQVILCPYCSAANDSAQERCRKCSAELGDAATDHSKQVQSIKVAPTPPRLRSAALRAPRSAARVFPVLNDELAPRVFAVRADPDGSVYLACRSDAETAADLVACRSDAQAGADLPSTPATDDEHETVRPWGDAGLSAAFAPAANAHRVDPLPDSANMAPVTALAARGNAAQRGAKVLIGVGLVAAVAAVSYYALRQAPEIRLTMLPAVGADPSAGATVAEPLPRAGQALSLPAASVATSTADRAPVPAAAVPAPQTTAALATAPVDAVALLPPRPAAVAVTQAGTPPERRVRTTLPSPAAVMAAPAPVPLRSGAATAAGERQPAPVGSPCTAAIAALGLCNLESPPRRP